MFEQLKKIVKNIIFTFIKLPVQVQYNSYAQAGEDMILNLLFSTMGIETPSYIDIGANLPDYGNNTYKFYLTGSTGICIEPDYGLFQNLQKKRPKDIILNVAIGFDSQKETDFYVFNEPSLNTMSEQEALRRDSLGEYKLVDKIKVKVETLENIIENYCKKTPTFISLDIEGTDFEVLKNFDLNKYKVPIFIVETIDYSLNHIKVKNHELIEYMTKNGYFVYADTYVNSIIIRTDWFYEYKNE